MSKFDYLRPQMVGVENLTALSEQAVQELKAKYPGIAEDYLDFLKQIGWGNFGTVMIYAEPIDPEEIYSAERGLALQGIAVFGDDMQGFCYGFDKDEHYRVVEIDPRGKVDRTIHEDFSEFIRSFIHEPEERET
ncbi:SMI1/KNR4 family protein [Verrucomicrobium spinosum]|uniref:SMI1/KNR4 family protein n=1 Tax=Verrucomicrobium spinosum TaxID=2736 RepID=UPI00017448E9|nr:SMI1/KNR4 family protein [Verrucomicrobium spinosum]